VVRAVQYRLYGHQYGGYAYPKRKVATIAMAAMREYASRFARIISCCHRAKDLQVYRELLVSD